MSKVCGIYSITNIINGKKLIGQSVDIERRVCSHKSALRHNLHYNHHLQRAWNKYGDQYFIIEVLLQCPVSSLDQEEIRLIQEYQTTKINKGYNLTEGGGRPTMPESQKEKIRRALMGHKCTEETKIKIRETKLKNPRKNYKMSSESKLKLSLAKKGKSPSLATRQNMSKAHIGHEVSQSTREKISKSRTGIHLPEKTRQKIRNTLLGRHRSPESIQKMREARRRYFAKVI